MRLADDHAGEHAAELSTLAYSAFMNMALRGLSYLPYRLRRSGLRLTFVCLRPILANYVTDRMVNIFAAILASSRRESRLFTYRKLRHDMVALSEWMALGRRSTGGLTRDISHLSTDFGDDLTWLASQRGAVIGTLHFGPYALGLAWLIRRYFNDHKIIIFKNEDSRDESRAIARLKDIGADVEFVSPKALAELPRITREIRQGAVAIIMVDMPPQIGRTDAFDLLGRPVSIATGAVDLAALARAPLMLLRTREGVKGDRVEIGEIFDIGRQDDESRARAASRVTRFIADTIHHYPEQWHMWERFDEYVRDHKRAAA